MVLPLDHSCKYSTGADLGSCHSDVCPISVYVCLAICWPDRVLRRQKQPEPCFLTLTKCAETGMKSIFFHLFFLPELLLFVVEMGMAGTLLPLVRHALGVPGFQIYWVQWA